ncbi:MAG: hypothetical protein G01um101425_395 [Candidatus Peregrinibacteria bacterium Gr01-1014_25]|nr:MAG: hypothetical protein G01um101425_395 [Candidatus Peregrinibacteria bacterium Gr01-1014_25]
MDFRIAPVTSFSLDLCGMYNETRTGSFYVRTPNHFFTIRLYALKAGTLKVLITVRMSNFAKSTKNAIIHS